MSKPTDTTLSTVTDDKSSWADDPISPIETKSEDVDDLRSLINDINLTKDTTTQDTTTDKDKDTEEPETTDMKESKEEHVDINKARLLAPVDEVDVTLNSTNTIYSSVSTFEDIIKDKDLLKGIYAMGFTTPSAIQAKALPLLLADPPQNLIGQSQAGTGKTAAFVLAMLTRIDYSLEKTQAICLAPARELARQIMDNIRDMGKYTRVTTVFAIKDSVAKGQILNEHIIVGTPGTVVEMIRRKQIDTANVKIFVLDEADNMIDQQGLGDQSVRIRKSMPRDCQIVLFSATFSEQVKEFAKKFAPGAHALSLKVQELSVDGIKQFYMDCKSESHKVEVLQALYGLLTIGQSIIFVARRETADLLAREMKKNGHTVFALHGKFETAERDTVIDDFRVGKFKVLITTNVIARGIDILSVNVVLNFDMPLTQNNEADPETYLHRIGRTGRFGRTGVSINFVHDARSKSVMSSIERHFGREMIRVPTENYQEIESILKKAVK